MDSHTDPEQIAELYLLSHEYESSLLVATDPEEQMAAKADIAATAGLHPANREHLDSTRHDASWLRPAAIGGPASDETGLFDPGD